MLCQKTQIPRIFTNTGENPWYLHPNQFNLSR